MTLEWINYSKFLEGKVDNRSKSFLEGNACPKSFPPCDDANHGHLVSVIISGKDKNEKYVGISPDAQILAVKVSDSNGFALLSDVANGVRYAADNGAKIINLSLGGDNEDFQLMEAVQYSVSKGIIIVASTGNDGEPEPKYPAAYAGNPDTKGLLLSVTSIEKDFSRSNWSESSSSNICGSTKNSCIAALGTEVLTSEVETDDIVMASGTSFAAPQVSAALALMIGAFPNLNARTTVNILMDSADVKSGDNVLPSPIYGRGLLNIKKALTNRYDLRIQTAGGAQYLEGTSISGDLAYLLTSVIERGEIPEYFAVVEDVYDRVFKVKTSSIIKGIRDRHGHVSNNLIGRAFGLKDIVPNKSENDIKLAFLLDKDSNMFWMKKSFDYKIPSGKLNWGLNYINEQNGLMGSNVKGALSIRSSNSVVLDVSYKHRLNRDIHLDLGYGLGVAHAFVDGNMLNDVSNIFFHTGQLGLVLGDFSDFGSRLGIYYGILPGVVSGKIDLNFPEYDNGHVKQSKYKLDLSKIPGASEFFVSYQKSHRDMQFSLRAGFESKNKNLNKFVRVTFSGVF